MNPSSSSDTRPIALLPELAEIQERLAFDKLLAHFENINLLPTRQACCRRGHSSQTALLGVSYDIREQIEKRKVALLTMLDFSKAFDCTPHEQLLEKLRKYTIADFTIKWIFSYLSDRHPTKVDDQGNISGWYTAYLQLFHRVV